MNKKTLLPFTLLSVFLCFVGCRNSQSGKTILKSAKELTENKSVRKDISKIVINNNKQPTKTINGKRNLLNDDEKKELKKELFTKSMEITSVWKCKKCGYTLTIKTKNTHLIQKKCKKCNIYMTRVWN